MYKSSCYDIGFILLTSSVEHFEFDIFPHEGKETNLIGIVVDKSPFCAQGLVLY